MTYDKEKYPIGPYMTPKGITMELIDQSIQVIEAFPNWISTEVKGLNRQELFYTYREGGWTIAQVVNHCADSHLMAYIRTKLAYSQKEPTINPYEEHIWAETVDGRSDEIDSSLMIIRGIHKRWVTFLLSLNETSLNALYHHPEYAHPLRLKDMIPMYAWHSKHHLAHIKQAKERNK